MLLILGNGFDIQCGLKTDYLSFFKKRYDEKKFQDLQSCINQLDYLSLSSNFTQHMIDSQVITIQDYYNRYRNDIFNEISVWDIIFSRENILDNNPGWYNIENLIFDYIAKNKITYAGILGIEKKIKSNTVTKDDKLYLMIYLLFDKLSLKFTPMLFNEWLLAQLNIIEEAFKLYVKNELNNKQDEYLEKTLKLYQEFTKIKDYDHKPLSLINFNYTTPEIGGSQEKYVTNIHGNVNKGNIIFGIDEKNSEDDSWIDPNDTKYLFTKTARKIHTYEDDENFILNKYGDKNILIYGHSLNIQDYSYFQSIFDIYNISEKDTIIYVAWTNYDKKRKIKTTTVNNAIKLLKYYGNSLKNDKGKNLLHRMLLEKRIRIIEIPVMH